MNISLGICWIMDAIWDILTFNGNSAGGDIMIKPKIHRIFSEPPGNFQTKRYCLTPDLAFVPPFSGIYNMYMYKDICMYVNKYIYICMYNLDGIHRIQNR